MSDGERAASARPTAGSTAPTVTGTCSSNATGAPQTGSVGGATWRSEVGVDDRGTETRR
jgi:hypothetical protein